MNSQAQNMNFYLPIKTPLPVTVLNLNHVEDKLYIDVELSPEAWDQVDLIMLFNLTWNNRGPGEVSGKKPVQINLALGKEIYQSLEAQGQLVTSLDAFLKLDKDHPMTNTANWYALEVTEEVDLPEHLKAKGSVREGFITQWKSTM